MTRKEKIYGYICSKDYKPLTAQELSIVLDVPYGDYDKFNVIIRELLSEGKIVQNKKGRLKKASDQKTIYGTLSLTKSGSAFVTPINPYSGEASDADDIFIEKDNTGFAFSGDVVSVKLLRASKPDAGKKREGAVIKIIHRASDELIGTVSAEPSPHTFIPDNMEQYAAHISKDSVYASEGQKAAAKIIRYPDREHSMKVRIIEVLGDSDDISTLISCVVRENKIPESFSSQSLNQAKATDSEVSEADLRSRMDFRGERVITIDGEDARDLDDAVCVKKHGDGTYTLYVHIADVSHYVGENTAIDLEAYERATSVYLPDRVIPMLPRELSNGICSLNEGADRLTMSVTMHIDKNGDVLDYKIEEGVIRSLHRMTYTDVEAILDGDTELWRKYADIKEDIFIMRELALNLKQKRLSRGSVDFNFPEPKIVLDGSGNVTDVKVYKTGVSNEIIEQFMLLANETVAKHAADNLLPFVFRVHETPSSEKLLNLQKYLNIFGIPFQIPETSDIQPSDIQTIIERIKNTPEEKAVSTLCLRSMMKARYSPENLGHFGLASKYYCHFTSPIRRYPDLVIHRILKESIKKGISAKRTAYLNSFAERAAVQSSEAELRAIDAERAADKVCMCVYMQQFVGAEFDARISSVTDFGLFVEIDGCIEGLVPMTQLCDDYYVYDEDFMRLRGENSGRMFCLGDAVRVRLSLSSPRQRRIDFEISGMKKQFTTGHAPKSTKKQKKKSTAKNQFKKFVKKKSKKKR